MAKRKSTPVSERVAATASRDVAVQAPTLGSQLKAMIPEFARAMPASMSADRLARIALTEVRRNPALADCTPGSFFGALMQCATLGVEPGLLGHAYLVPFNNRKAQCKEVQFILGYKGMLDLVKRSGQVEGTPTAAIIHENDLFDLFRDNTGEVFNHTPYWLRKDSAQTEPGKIIGAYVYAKYLTGGIKVHAMPICDIEKRRKRSMAKDNGPWKTDYEAMVLKTVVRAAFPWLPVSIEDAARVAEVEGNVTNIDPATLEVKVIDLEHERVTVTDDGEIVDEAPKQEEKPRKETPAPVSGDARSPSEEPEPGDLFNKKA